MKQYVIVKPGLVRQANRNRFSKAMVTISIFIPFVYTVVSLYFAWYGKFIPSELTIGVYGFFGTELLAVAYRTKNDNGGM